MDNDVRISNETHSVIKLKTLWNSVKTGLAEIEFECLTNEQNEKIEIATELIDNAIEQTMISSINQAIFDSGGRMI